MLCASSDETCRFRGCPGVSACRQRWLVSIIWPSCGEDALCPGCRCRQSGFFFGVWRVGSERGATPLLTTATQPRAAIGLSLRSSDRSSLRGAGLDALMKRKPGPPKCGSEWECVACGLREPWWRTRHGTGAAVDAGGVLPPGGDGNDKRRAWMPAGCGPDRPPRMAGRAAGGSGGGDLRGTKQRPPRR